MAQITDLLFLSPEIQADVLAGHLAVSEYRLRDMLSSLDWKEQRATLDAHAVAASPRID